MSENGGVDGERELPAGWAWAKLGEIADTSLGKMLDKKQSTGENPTPYLRNVNVQWGEIDTVDLLTMDIEPDDLDRFTVSKGDLVVCEGGEIGRCAIWNREEPIAYQKALHRVRASEALDTRYLRYYLEYAASSGKLARFATGSTIKHLPQQRLREVPVPVPPLAEQHRIVEALEEQLSRLDKAKAQVKVIDVRAEKLVARCIDDLALGEGWRNREPLTADSLLQLGPSKTNRIRYEALPQLPPEWRWRRAEEVCVKIFCGSTPKAHLMHPGSGDVPFLKVYNIARKGGIDFSVNPTFVDVETHEGLLKRSCVKPGDVVTNIVGPPLGKTALIPAIYPEWNINQAIVAFRGDDSVTPDWLALVLRSSKILGMLQSTAKATAGQFNVALSTCRDLPIPVPPAVVQQEVAARAQELVEGIERLGLTVSAAHCRADLLHRAVLRKAFSGDLVPQNPEDEPAAVLLASIADEYAAKPKGKRPRKATDRKLAKAPAPRAAEDRRIPESTPAPALAVQQEFEL